MSISRNDLEKYLLSDEFHDEGIESPIINSNKSKILKSSSSSGSKKKKDGKFYSDLEIAMQSIEDDKKLDKLNKKRNKTKKNQSSDSLNSKEEKKDINNFDDEFDDELLDFSSSKPSHSNVEFIIAEDENNEKKLIINLELTMKNSLNKKELLKIDFEICKEIYLDLIKELLK